MASSYISRESESNLQSQSKDGEKYQLCIEKGDYLQRRDRFVNPAPSNRARLYMQGLKETKGKTAGNRNGDMCVEVMNNPALYREEGIKHKGEKGEIYNKALVT
ncbi:hypothetical protein H102_01770 [Trichophyton rubrum CBS 100081]|nr:hypothetical protein H102_01770 [Trichophyton rubrum CBS 100081]